MPNWPLYIQPHMKMPMAIGTIHGGMVSTRKIARPGTAAGDAGDVAGPGGGGGSGVHGCLWVRR